MRAPQALVVPPSRSWRGRRQAAEDRHGRPNVLRGRWKKKPGRSRAFLLRGLTSLPSSSEHCNEQLLHVDSSSLYAIRMDLEDSTR